MYDVWYVAAWDQREQQPSGLLFNNSEAVSLGERLHGIDEARRFTLGRLRRLWLRWWYGPGIIVILDRQGRRVLPVYAPPREAVVSG